jgi:hypothetical protein
MFIEFLNIYRISPLFLQRILRKRRRTPLPRKRRSRYFENKHQSDPFDSVNVIARIS